MHKRWITVANLPPPGVETSAQQGRVLQVRHSERERVGGIDRGHGRQPQYDPNHLGYLRFFRSPMARDSPLDKGRRIFVYGEARTGTHEQRDPASVPQLGRSLCVSRVEQCLDAGYDRRMSPYDLLERALDGHQSSSDGRTLVGVDDSVGVMNEARSSPLDYAPSKMSRPRVDT
jgi:hypothetical protein